MLLLDDVCSLNDLSLEFSLVFFEICRGVLKPLQGLFKNDVYGLYTINLNLGSKSLLNSLKAALILPRLERQPGISSESLLQLLHYDDEYYESSRRVGLFNNNTTIYKFVRNCWINNFLDLY